MRTEEELREEIRRLEFHGQLAKYREFENKAMSVGMTEEQVDWVISTRYWFMYQALRFALGYEYNSSNSRGSGADRVGSVGG